MPVLVLTLASWLLLLPCTGAVQTPASIRGSEKARADSILITGQKSKSSTEKKQNRESATPQVNNNLSTKQTFFHLNTPADFTISLESLENASDLPIADTVYVLLPVKITNQKLPVVYKLRLIGQDSSQTKFQDYRLIVQTSNNATTTQPATAQTSMIAQWRPGKGKNVSIQFFKAKLNTAHSALVKASPITATNKANAFWQPLAFLLSTLFGIFGLLWATSRFLVFSVKVSRAKKKKFKKNDRYPADLKTEENISGLNAAVPPAEPPATIQGNSNQTGTLGSSDAGLVVLPGNKATQAYFFTELMLTAGPRKKYMSDPEADKDLGEDVCGLVADQDQLLLWVLDGTSDQYCLRHPFNKKEYFSSRLLAQSVANKLRLNFPRIETTALDQLLSQAVVQIKAEWLQRVQELPPEEQEILRTNILNKNIPECATTILFGTLTLGGHMVAYRSGDCKMVLYTKQLSNEPALLESSLHQKNERSNDRLFFRLVLDAEGEFNILHNSPRFEIIEHNEVHALAAFSDGIGLETEACLRELPDKSLSTLREDIIYQMQGTADDKAICFVEIRRLPEPVPATSFA